MTEGWKWLESTKSLQENVYKYDYVEMQDEHPPAMMAKYLDWNTTAAVQELAEVREEFSWKPWAKDEPFVNGVRVLEEIIDVMHFLGNMLTAIGVDDQMFELKYMAKQEINRQRAKSNRYSAKKGGLSQGSDVRG